MNGLIPLPSQVDRFIRLPAGAAPGAPIRFVLLEDLVALNLHACSPASAWSGRACSA